MARGRDEEFKARLAGGVDLSAIKEGPPDPRRMPATLHETTFRMCYDEWTVVRLEDGTVMYYQFSIIDPIDRHVYHYGLNRQAVQKMVDDMTQMLSETESDPETVRLVTEDPGPIQ